MISRSFSIAMVAFVAALPIVAAADASPPGTSTGGRASNAAIGVAVRNVWWSKTTDGAAFFHVRVVLTATSRISASSGQFRAVVADASGATKSIPALATTAPDVLRSGYRKYSGNAWELEPSIVPTDDFGAMGTIAIAPASPVTTVLTFATAAGPGTLAVRSVTFGDARAAP